LYLTPYIPIIRRYSQAKIVLRAHNVEHEIWERVAANTNQPFQRWYLNRITPRLKNYEIAHLNNYDLVAAITARDAAHLRQLGLQKPIMVTPIGLDCRDYQPDMRVFQHPLSLSFIGSLDWIPNQEGLKWFLESVWQPLLHPRFPQLRFHIAGRTAPAWLRSLQMAGVHFHGEVESAPDFINQHALMVVPLLSGGGMRAKILEGMAVGKVVLSTRVGMEGIDAQHGRECLLADTPEEFAEAIGWCMNNRERLAAIGQNAFEFCGTHYDNLHVAERLLEQFRKLRNEKIST
jgi:glycosyltransferase involved in cell wall biosynthesis